jgi:hypothetical protein
MELGAGAGWSWKMKNSIPARAGPAGGRRQGGASWGRVGWARQRGRCGCLLRTRLLPVFMSTGEAHGGLQRLQSLELDINAQGLLRAGEEQLNLLGIGEGSCAREEHQELLPVVRHRPLCWCGGRRPARPKD